MPLSGNDRERINDRLRVWRQGDVCLDEGLVFLHLADLSQPHSSASEGAADYSRAHGEAGDSGPTAVVEDVRGFVMLTQTCDVVRDCLGRPFVEVAPLIPVSSDRLEAIRCLKQPARAYVSAMAKNGWVADLDRTMTVEKSVVATWKRVPGWQKDAELREFSQALARKRARFAFPDSFVAAAQKLRRRWAKKHEKKSEEGAHLRALREIRIAAAPSWDDDPVFLTWWFIRKTNSEIPEASWSYWVEYWLDLFDEATRFTTDVGMPCRLDDLTAQDYVDSHHLDLDSLSVPRTQRRNADGP